jgi:voltage-gated potassium channel
MSDLDQEIEHSLENHAIIAGFGVPGRAAADLLTARHVPFCVIELNPKTVERCSLTGVPIIAGDVCDEKTLRRAGVERCNLLVLAVPADAAVLKAIGLARRMNPSLRIIARCRFISSGMEAHRLGAAQVIVEEMVVATEITRLLDQEMAPVEVQK